MNTDRDKRSTDHRSRRTGWIQRRWRTAFHTVCAIGNFRKLTDRHDQSLEIDCQDSDVEPNRYRRHSLVPIDRNLTFGDQKCAVCGDRDWTPSEDAREEEDDRDVNNDQRRHDGQSHRFDRLLRCQQCKLVVHAGCLDRIADTCQSQKPRFVLRKQKSATPEDEEDGGGNGGGDEAAAAAAAAHAVDPIYLALKEANRMASNRRLSLASSPSPVGPNGACSPRDLTPTDSMKELTVNRSAAGYGRLSASTSGTSCASSYGYSKSLRSSPTRMQAVSSSPSLVAQKSNDDPSVEPRRSHVAPSAAAPQASGGNGAHLKPLAQKRPPKLDSKMKSLSLDCPDAKVRSKTGGNRGYSPVGPRVLKVRPCKNSSFDMSDDGAAGSSTSCSPCPSPYCGSSVALPSSSYVVTHDHRAKFAEEIDLEIGERAFVFDTGDPDWWQGQNIHGRIGIFPSTCVAHVHSNERVMQVVQNLNLWDGTKSLRLYRDQVVFVQQEEPDGLAEIRTERDHRINCPLQYLVSVD